MTTLAIAAFVLLQSVISVRPGFVDLADGKTNVQKYEHVQEGQTVQTGPDGHIEIGLGLDSLLRLDANSAIVLESLDKSNVTVRIISGGALLEVPKLDKPNRIHIATGNIKALIDAKGVFHFSGSTASVTEGRLKFDDAPLTVQKGWQVTNSGGEYRQSKMSLITPPAFKAYMNSPKAGFVNAVSGQVNLRPADVAREDDPIKTGPSSYAEVLLSPGAFLRVDENSEVVLESAGLNDVVIRVVSGNVLIEDIASDPRLPIRVNIGGTKVLIAASGLYRFTSDTAAVLDGAIRLGQKGESAYDGTLVRMANKQYKTEDLPDDVEPTGLDLWSTERSHLLSRSNLLADFSDAYANFFLYVSPMPYLAAWMYSPSLNGFTFVPRLTRESHYGNSFVPLYVLMPSTPVPPIAPARIPVPPPAPPTATPAPAPPPTTAPAPTAPAPAPAPAPTAPAPAPPPTPTK
jgi:ferric-dicitrate binding protein FerR (iron transport regulator)